LIETWHNYEIGASKQWMSETYTHLDAADIILLLISPDSVSDHFFHTELERAMLKHEQRAARVVPILLRPLDWEGAPFAKLSFLPTNTKPVVKWRVRDEAFVDIARGIRAI